METFKFKIVGKPFCITIYSSSYNEACEILDYYIEEHELNGSYIDNV